jgi:two-component system, OmpR family, response regulator MtrA
MVGVKELPKVLVVDDDPDLAALCSLLLESEGYDTDIARNGFEAYKAISDDHVDVVLLDAMMPVLDGLTVCRMIKKDPNLKDLPVIVMSASRRLCDEARGKADAVISKPFDLDNLVNTVHQFAYPA